MDFGLVLIVTLAAIFNMVVYYSHIGNYAACEDYEFFYPDQPPVNLTDHYIVT